MIKLEGLKFLLYVMSKISGIIFDHDGTLINSLPQVIQSTQEVLDKFGFPRLTEEQIRHSMILATTERMAFSAGQPENLKLGREMAGAWFERADQLALDHTEAYEGMHDLVKYLHESKVKLAVLSNNRGSLVRKIMAERELMEYFPIAFGEEDVPKTKPDPSGVEMILQCWGMEPSDVLFIGDSSSDYGAAKSSGCRDLGVCWGAHTRSELEPMGWEYLVDTVSEAKEYLSGLI